MAAHGGITTVRAARAKEKNRVLAVLVGAICCHVIMGIREGPINRLTFEPTLGAVLLPCLEFADVRLKSCILLLPILVLLVRRAAEDAVD